MFIVEVTRTLRREREVWQHDVERMGESLEILLGFVASHGDLAEKSGPMETAPVSDFVDDALRLSETGRPFADGELRRDYSVTPSICIEKFKLSRVLLAMIAHAREAMEELPERESRLVVSIEAGREGTLLIKVRDNGPEIPKEELAQLFRQDLRDSRFDIANDLHMAANAAAQIGSGLSVESGAVGTTFLLVLASE